MDEIDNILNDNSPSENPVETEDAEQPKEKLVKNTSVLVVLTLLGL